MSNTLGRVAEQRIKDRELSFKQNAELMKKAVQNFEQKKRGNLREIAKRIIQDAPKNYQRMKKAVQNFEQKKRGNLREIAKRIIQNAPKNYQRSKYD